MFVIRPIKESDLPGLEALAKSADAGLTTLPDDPAYLRDKIIESLRAFDEKVRRPRGENYLFVLEDTQKAEIVGTSGIISKVGGFEPFYTYQVTTEHHEDKELGVKKDMKLLKLLTKHDGPTEICSLFLHPDKRRAGLGRLLSLSRFLFMTEFSERFEDTVISELRGISDKNGSSPFWECVGRHFFNTDFKVADILTGLGHKTFIKNLMPRYPIYVDMLPQAARDVIGQVHKNSEPALHLLLNEGFQYTDEVDIFDSGPTVMARLVEIRSVDKSAKTKLGRISREPIDSEEHIVCNTRLDFRACLGKVGKEPDGMIRLEAMVADALEIKEDDEVRFVSLK